MLPGLAPPCAWLMTTVASLSSLPVSSLLHCCPQYSVWEPQKTAPVLQVTSFPVFPKTSGKHGSGWEDPAIRAGGAGDFSARENPPGETQALVLSRCRDGIMIKPCSRACRVGSSGACFDLSWAPARSLKTSLLRRQIESFPVTLALCSWVVKVKDIPQPLILPLVLESELICSLQSSLGCVAPSGPGSGWAWMCWLLSDCFSEESQHTCVPRGRGCQQTDRLAVQPEARPISRILWDRSLSPSVQPLPNL